MEEDLQEKMEDDLNKNKWKTTSKKNGRQPKKNGRQPKNKMEDNLKKGR